MFNNKLCIFQVRLNSEVLESAKLDAGGEYLFTLSPLLEQPEPCVPEDLLTAIYANSEALETWESTTTIARIDWVHWVESAKQTKTRVKRISEACDMLAEGKRRVCCFDNSGFYSKAFKLPKV